MNVRVYVGNVTDVYDARYDGYTELDAYCDEACEMELYNEDCDIRDSWVRFEEEYEREYFDEVEEDSYYDECDEPYPPQEDWFYPFGPTEAYGG